MLKLLVVIVLVIEVEVVVTVAATTKSWKNGFFFSVDSMKEQHTSELNFFT